MRLVAILSVALLLAGCSTSANWSKPISPPAVRKAAPPKPAAAPTAGGAAGRVETAAPSAAPVAPTTPPQAATRTKRKWWPWRLFKRK